MLDTSDRRSVRAAEKADVRRERERGEYLAHIMSTTSGRQFIWDLLSKAGLFHSSAVVGDPYMTYFAEGRRSMGQHLLDIVIQYAPDMYIQAMREANERRTLSDTPDRTAGQRSGPEDTGRDDQGRGGDASRDDDIYGEGSSREDDYR